MAGVLGHATTAEITTGTSLKTLLQVVAASNHRIKILGIEVYFKGIVGTDAPIRVRILRQTTAGTMSSLTPVKNCDGDDETLQTTAQHTATAEPTAGDILKTWEVHPQTGLVFLFPMGQEIIVKGGGRLGVDVLAGVSTSAVASLIFDE
jgi:hypothetical protein